jgi:hypothetical protein
MTKKEKLETFDAPTYERKRPCTPFSSPWSSRIGP